MQVIVNVVDHDRSVIEMLTSLFKRQGFRCQFFNSAQEFVTTYVNTAPSITFISSELMGDGIRHALDKLRLGSSDSAIIMTAPGVGTSQLVQAMKAGGEDVLEKPFSDDQVLAAIRRLASSPTVVIHRAHIVSAEIADQLTIEERRILSLIKQGVAIKQIASRMDISVRTVHYRKASILEKTTCDTFTEVIAKLSAMRTHAMRPANVSSSEVFCASGSIAVSYFQPVSG
jgi:FixJ family two-component response regulator